MRILVCALFLFEIANADTFPVRASYGELVESPRKCGPATRDEIRRFIADDLQVHVAEPLAYSTGSAANVVADKQYAQDGQTIGVWRRGKRSIVIALRTLKRGTALGCTITFLVEQDPNARDKVSCFERWVGQVMP
jgi:hypothetical protein